MKYAQILEGVEYGDLASLITTRVSIAEFEPKTGSENDVVVIGFYCDDEAPAQDLASFIEKSAADVLDTEVSPAADEDGYYMCFVEVVIPSLSADLPVISSALVGLHVG